MTMDIKGLPILCMDFDGVIHQYIQPWQGADVIPDEPVEGAFKFLVQAMEKFRVAIYSARSGQEGGISAMKEWFIEKGFEFTDSLYFPETKPPAFISIDDRCLTFNGVFPDVQDLIDFKPWNKRGV